MGFFNKIKKVLDSTKDETIDKSSPTEKIRNFKYLDELIHSGTKEIVLESDIKLGREINQYIVEGIKLDVDDLVIDGNGHVIDADGKTQIFHCTGKNVTIKNIILKNGFTRYEGGAIYNSGELSIHDSTFSENVAEGRGGAIYNSGELSIYDSTFSENTTNNSYTGVICNRNGELNITSSTFSKNRIHDYDGLIYNENGGELNVTDSIFYKNQIKESGGVIYNDKGNSKVFKCNILNNTSLENIILNNDFLEIYNTNFKHNQSNHIILNDGANLTIFYGEFVGNNVGKSVIINYSEFCSIENTTFENNLSDNSINIINYSELTLIIPKIKDKGKTILNQKYILIKKSSPELENRIYGEGTVEIVGNPPNEDKFDFRYLDKKIRESNTKEIILDQDIKFENYERDYYEGGIELNIDNLVIDGNGHTIDGAEKSRIFIITGKNIILKNIIFKNGYSYKNYDNSLNNPGGAIKINHMGSLTIENCEFNKNISEEYGGVIYAAGELNIIKSIFNWNTADSLGGAIYNKSTKLNIKESTFSSNMAMDKDGGAIYNDSGEFHITKSTFNWNTAKNGGAIYNDSGEFHITKSTFTENTIVQWGGGAIYNASGKLNIIESSFDKNMASFDGSGGAIYNYGDEIIISKSAFSKNVAKHNGGAIFLNNSTKYGFDNCAFNYNEPDNIYQKTD